MITIAKPDGSRYPDVDRVLIHDIDNNYIMARKVKIYGHSKYFICKEHNVQIKVLTSTLEKLNGSPYIQIHDSKYYHSILGKPIMGKYTSGSYTVFSAQVHETDVISLHMPESSDIANVNWSPSYTGGEIEVSSDLIYTARVFFVSMKRPTLSYGIDTLGGHRITITNPNNYPVKCTINAWVINNGELNYHPQASRGIVETLQANGVRIFWSETQNFAIQVGFNFEGASEPFYLDNFTCYYSGSFSSNYGDYDDMTFYEEAAYKVTLSGCWYQHNDGNDYPDVSVNVWNSNSFRVYAEFLDPLGRTTLINMGANAGSENAYAEDVPENSSGVWKIATVTFRDMDVEVPGLNSISIDDMSNSSGVGDY